MPICLSAASLSSCVISAGVSSPLSTLLGRSAKVMQTGNSHQRGRILTAEHALGAFGKGHADGQQPVFFLLCRTGQHLAVTAVYAVKEAERHGGGFFFLE